MENIIIILGIIFVIIGLLGCFFPGIPGPPFVYISLLILHFFTDHAFSNKFLIFWGFIVVLSTVADNFVQAFGVKVFGGNKKAIAGSIIGFFIGFFLPIPFGIMIGMFVGALVGAMIETKNDFEKAVKIAMGTIFGFIASVFLKLAISCFLVYQFFNIIFKNTMLL